MEFFKALGLGAVLTFVVCGLIGSGGSKGGFLMIEHLYIQGHGFYWSWVMFVAGTMLSWFILAIMP